ncbi:MAG: hypothetical protein NWE98_03820 [Candidatus Bathyarchaeota archaeon]|nr:hypothetical protein [Candidatus Bathyarchaeota archaeon]
MESAEQVSIANAVFTNNRQVTVTVRNTGTATITLNSATIDGQSVKLDSAGTPDGDVAKGTSVEFTLTLGETFTFVQGAQYEIRLVTAKGTTIIYAATYYPTS